MAETYSGEVRNGSVVFDGGVPPLLEGARLRIEVVEAIGEGDEATPTLADRLRSVIGAAKGLPADLAEQHDHYIHGTPKQ
jgi:hypothetical protein